MEEKIIAILLDIQKDVKELKERVGRLEERVGRLEERVECLEGQRHIDSINIAKILEYQI
mgnify:CR=1 FL=1